MAIVYGARHTCAIGPAVVEALGAIPVAILGDEVNRSCIMHSGIRPMGTVKLSGIALTVECMVGDNSPLHYALARLSPGEIIVADARAHVETAVWGQIMHTCAKARGAAGVVIDGALRDSVAIAHSGLPAFARGVCPRGPHKGWGGSINRTIQCGGVAVSPGDLVIGDSDGVIVLSPDIIEGLFERCQRRLAHEALVLEQVSAGQLTITALGMPHDSDMKPLPA
jgi:4-hydroxy-4-methyl-2-oxoglutarate aldolase